jgi:hypothetical protein
MAASDDCNLQCDLYLTLTTSRADFADDGVRSHSAQCTVIDRKWKRMFRFIRLRGSPIPFSFSFSGIRNCEIMHTDIVPITNTLTTIVQQRRKVTRAQCVVSEI